MRTSFPTGSTSAWTLILFAGAAALCFAGFQEDKGKKEEPEPGSPEPAAPPGKGSGKDKPAGKKAAGKDKDRSKPEGSAASPAAADVEHVKAHLKDFVQGTVAFSEDGTVTIDYDFKSKKDEFRDDFTPPISDKPQATFRWSLSQEERSVGSDYGVRISDKGACFLNVWFLDDVEASAEFLQGINWSKRQTLAVAFQAKNGKGIGNNYGAQCATFQGAAFQGGAPSGTEPLAFNVRIKLGLKVRGGTYEALRNDKPRGSAKYTPRNFPSGRIGFIWGGAVAGTLTSLSVKGKIDFTETAKAMRKR